MTTQSSFNISINGNEYNIEIKKIGEGQATVDVNGTSYEVSYDNHRKPSKTPRLVRQPAYTSEMERPLKTSSPGESKKRFVKAPLPGVILSVNVKEGVAVKAGEIIVVMEAMKMENNIVAPADGIVQQIKVVVGANVLEGDELFELGGGQNA
ncbi:MAG: biotin/lipoyl-containing protein [Bacteroidota bacterium]